MIKKTIRSIFHLAGLEISRKQSLIGGNAYYRNTQMMQGLDRCKKRGIEVNTIIDVGAAAGSWSLSASEFWPEANYILFEPLTERKAELEQLAAKKSNIHFVPAAAGKEKGQVSFNISSDLDGSGVIENAKGSNIRTVEVTSIDDEVQKLNLNGPFIVKLDTHGFEKPIIEGCSETISYISLFIIECYGFYIAKNSLLFWEMCRYMDAKGFRLIDIVDILYRPKDDSFWQCDAFFVPKGLDLFNNNSYQ